MTKFTAYSLDREIKISKINLARGLHLNKRLKMDGLVFLNKLPPSSCVAAFFDPQYRGLLDKMKYGDEGKNRFKGRMVLKQMNDDLINKFVLGINKSVIPSGHLFLWVDKFHLCTGFSNWLINTDFEIVDMLTWGKDRMGMGYRTRKSGEYLVVLQKKPRRAKGVWKVHNIMDVWIEKIDRKLHAHRKPVNLQGALIEAVTNKGDIVIDPAAGSFSVMEACIIHGRDFLGCDLNG